MKWVNGAEHGVKKQEDGLEARRVESTNVGMETGSGMKSSIHTTGVPQEWALGEAHSML